jgi:hypothetical protein
MSPFPLRMFGMLTDEFETSAPPRIVEYISSGSGIVRMVSLESTTSTKFELEARCIELGRGSVVDSVDCICLM